MKLKVILFIAIATLINQTTFAQYNSGNKKKGGNGAREPHHSVIKGDFKLPTTLGNEAFRKVINGIMDSDLEYNYRLTNNLRFGIGAKYSLWDIDVNAFPSTKVNGKIQNVNPFISVGMVFPQDQQFYIETEMKFGYNLMETSSNIYNSYKQTAINFEPKVGFYLQTTDLLAFGLTVNYNYIATNFSPANLNLNSFPTVSAGGSDGNMQYFSIGFGFYTFIPNADDKAAREHN